MDPAQAKALAEKVKNGIATQQEELELLKFLNQGVKEMKEFIKSVME